ncbi:hypothetical protein B5P22_31005 [Pseudomonas tolaasii]|uniref:hypothetical protein n=1 Tax=Pseudomonas tolaasii TaxID=29442 RepID=UPI0009B6E4A3|nr:hypothetical protein [Pseudomonas tolaasii]ARB31536.1 hypothetical protein B5P22_31005 [Pseudomonas tolaasii]
MITFENEIFGGIIGVNVSESNAGFLVKDAEGIWYYDPPAEAYDPPKVYAYDLLKIVQKLNELNNDS